MGDRFILVRLDSRKGRRAAGKRAISNTGNEIAMRGELSDAVSYMLNSLDDGADLEVSGAEKEALSAAADLVTLARTAVERDYRGDVVDAHDPEMPTRFAKQLAQIMRGVIALRMDRTLALALAIRCARDSMPPIRLRIIDDVAEHPGSSTTDVRKRLGLPRTAVDRELQALHMLGVLTMKEEENHRGTVYRYAVSDGIEPTALLVPDSAVGVPREGVPSSRGRVGTAISGTTSESATCGCGAARTTWTQKHGEGRCMACIGTQKVIT